MVNCCTFGESRSQQSLIKLQLDPRPLPSRSFRIAEQYLLLLISDGRAIILFYKPGTPEELRKFFLTAIYLSSTQFHRFNKTQIILVKTVTVKEPLHDTCQSEKSAIIDTGKIE